MELIVSGLARRYGAVEALRRVSLTAPVGVTVLLGPNGAGKSTLLRLLATVERADTGLIALGGHAYADDPGPVRARLGYMPQRLDLPGELTPRRLLRYVAALKRLAGRRPEDDLLAELRLDAVADRRLSTLSVGQTRLVGLAQALIGAPRLLLLDEPLSGLAVEERALALAALRRRAGATTVLLSTHTPDEVATMARQVVVLRAGGVVAQGTVADLRRLAGLGGGAATTLEETYLRVIGGDAGVGEAPRSGAGVG